LFGLTAIFGESAFFLFFLAILVYSLLDKHRSVGILFLSGLLKVSPIVTLLPIDLTLFSMCVYLAYRFIDFVSYPSINRKLFQIGILLLIMWFVVTFSLLYTMADWSFIGKSGIYILILYLPLSLIILTEPNSNSIFSGNLISFITPTILLGSIWTGMGFHNYIFKIPLYQIENPVAYVTHFSAFGENYMYFSTFVCFLILYSFVSLINNRRPVLLWVGFMIIQYFLLLNSPARGLTIGLFFSLLLLSAPHLQKIKVRYLLTFLGITLILIIGTIVYLGNELTNEQAAAFNRLTDFSLQGKSISDRIISVKNAFLIWDDSLISILFGLGVDSVAFINKDPGLYAHNIILEAILEYGVLGSIPIIVFFLFAFYKSIGLLSVMARARSELLWILGIYYVIFIFGLFSGTLGNSRLLWILTSIIYLLSVNLSCFREELKSIELNKEKNTTPF
jgi:hypothetical protein